MSRAAEGHRFNLTVDAAFPCKVKLEERQSALCNGPEKKL